MIELRGACARHRPALLDFVDRGEIASGTAGALAHLDRCDRCTDELESTVLTITALRRLGDDDRPCRAGARRVAATPGAPRPPRPQALGDHVAERRDGDERCARRRPRRAPPARHARPPSDPLRPPASSSGRRLRRASGASRPPTSRRVRQGTLPVSEPADPAAGTSPARYPDDIRPDTEGGEPGRAERRAAGGYLTPMGSMPIVPGAQEPNAHRTLARIPFDDRSRQAMPDRDDGAERMPRVEDTRRSCDQQVWGDTLSGRSIDAETSRWVARGRGRRVRGMRDSGQSVAVGIGAERRSRPPRRRRRRPPAEPAAEAIDLTNTAYAPEEGTDGGSIIIGDWQEANQFNPYYVGQVTEANVASAAWSSTRASSPTTIATRPTSRQSIPTIDNGGVKAPGDGGDAMTVTWTLRDGLKWSDGEPLTCDDFKYAWEWVLDPGQRRRHHDRLRRTSPTVECASDTEMVWHFKNIYEGYITLFGAAAAAPLPRADSDRRPGQRRRLPGRRNRQPADQRRVQVRVGHAAAGAAPGPERRTTRALRPASRPTSTTSSGSGTATPTCMIAGFKAGEVDFATDLQDSDIPKVQDLGDQVSAIPALLYEFLRPNWSEGPFDATKKIGGCSRNPTVQDRGRAARWQTRPCVRRLPSRSTRTRSTAGSWAAPSRSPTRTSPPAPGSSRTRPPATFDPAKAKSILEEAGWVDGAATASGRRTA